MESRVTRQDCTTSTQDREVLAPLQRANEGDAAILLVDDDVDTRATLARILVMQGFEVMTAQSASEALERVSERPPDLIVTDHRMPWMTGLELCRALRAQAQTRRIPIILHTASELPDDASRLCNCVIAKPADPDALLAMIRSLTARSIAT